MQFEFEFTRESLDILGSRTRRNVFPRTNRFLNTVIDPVYLGIIDATVMGENISQAQRNSELAIVAIDGALQTLNTCVR